MMLSYCRAQPKRPEIQFRTLLNQIETENNPSLTGSNRNGGDFKFQIKQKDLGSNPNGGRSVHLHRSRHIEIGNSCMSGCVRASGAAGFGAGAERFVHDLLDGAHAASALGAAAQATIDLPRRPWRLGPGDSLADVMVGEDVAGTDDHQVKARSQVGTPVG
jgi:hypothetical protein